MIHNNRWTILYRKEIKSAGGTDKYIKLKIKEKSPLIKEIVKYAGRRRKILEAGCGTGIVSSCLASEGYHVTALDKNKSILELAKVFSRSNLLKPSYVKGTITSLNFPEKCFDICFSHGVMEHFSDTKILQILNEELRIADYVIFSVPSNFFKEKDKMYGNERFLDLNYWKNLISKSNGRLIDKFSFFHSSPLYKVRLLKLLYTLSLRIFPLTKPYIGFVIKNE